MSSSFVFDRHSNNSYLQTTSRSQWSPPNAQSWDRTQLPRVCHPRTSRDHTSQ